MNPTDRSILFSRMLGLLSEDELNALINKKVAIPGCGGTGFTYAECLVRMGIGKIHISDSDTFGLENMNRQFGCTIHTVGEPKVEVLQERLTSINKNLECTSFGAVDEENLSDFLEGVDVVCDTMDFFAITPRRRLYQEARKRGIAVQICCPVAWGVTSHRFDPHGMSFDEFFGIDDSMTEDGQLSAFGNGLAPAKLYKAYIESPKLDFENKSVSSVSSSCLMATSFGSSQALNILLGKDLGFKAVPHWYNIDIIAGRFESGFGQPNVQRSAQIEETA
ncbi:MAG: ThiF family adenylyltransferase [Sedimenticola sp.]